MTRETRDKLAALARDAALGVRFVVAGVLAALAYSLDLVADALRWASDRIAP